MYLQKKTYVKQWKHTPKETKYSVSVRRGGKKFPGINPKSISYVTEEVAYWRKFNALHGWFIKNCADDTDDCSEVYVHIDKLKELLQTLKDIVETPEKAPKLLPVTSEFFFGSDAYDKYYWEDVKDTIKVLEETLKDSSSYENSYFFYLASW